MKNLLIKEMKLAASPLSYIFIVFAVMALIPGYPILVGVFFVCLGIFQSFQSGRDNNDVLYTVLLPVRKTDVVRAKYIFVVFIEMTSFVIAAALTIFRMIAMTDSAAYVHNAMMNANQAYLGYTLIIFALFNVVFLNGFFKTAYKFGRPFIVFIILSFVFTGIVETIHHIPGLEFLNATATMGNAVMWMIFILSTGIYILATFMACRSSMKRFEQVDM